MMNFPFVPNAHWNECTRTTKLLPMVWWLVVVSVASKV